MPINVCFESPNGRYEPPEPPESSKWSPHVWLGQRRTRAAPHRPEGPIAPEYGRHGDAGSLLGVVVHGMCLLLAITPVR